MIIIFLNLNKYLIPIKKAPFHINPEMRKKRMVNFAHHGLSLLFTFT